MYDTLRFRLWYGATGNWGLGSRLDVNDVPRWVGIRVVVAGAR